MHDRREASAKRERMWRVAPAGALTSMLETLQHMPEVWRWLPEDVWRAWLDHLFARPAAPLPSDMFEAMPANLAMLAVRRGLMSQSFAHDARVVLWSRVPGELHALVDELALGPPPDPRETRLDLLGGLVWSAPPEHAPPLLDRAHRWLAEPARYPAVGSWLDRWLLHIIEERRPGWRRAFELAIAAAPGECRSRGVRGVPLTGV